MDLATVLPLVVADMEQRARVLLLVENRRQIATCMDELLPLLHAFVVKRHPTNVGYAAVGSSWLLVHPAPDIAHTDPVGNVTVVYWPTEPPALDYERYTYTEWQHLRSLTLWRPPSPSKAPHGGTLYDLVKHGL